MGASEGLRSERLFEVPGGESLLTGLADLNTALLVAVALAVGGEMEFAFGGLLLFSLLALLITSTRTLLTTMYVS